MRKITFLLFIIFISFFNTFSQETEYSNIPIVDYKKTREYIIADVQVRGIKYLPVNSLINLSGLRVGEKIEIPGEKITKTIKKMWDHGLFSDVKISITKTEGDKVYLELYLQERSRLSEVVITGVGKTAGSDIKEAINLKPGSQVTDNVINNTKYITKKHFTDKGFLNAQVNVFQKEDTSGFNSVILFIDIQKNKRIKIRNIEFKNNEKFSDRRLRRVLKKTKKKNLNIFKSAKLIDSDYKEDRQKLIGFYNEKGYRDAKITDEKITPVNNKRINLAISVDEGKQYYIRNITWIGNTKYPSEYLDNVLGVKKGDIYNNKVLEERLQTDEDAISSIYMDNGYLFFSITPVDVNIENDSVDIEMRIYEGTQATISHVIVKGNTVTNEHVVRRELYTRPGELFSKTDIIRSIREIANLGHFNPETITPNPVPNEEDGTVTIEYQLEERANDQLEISGGWGGYYGFVGSVGVRFSNFSSRNFFNWKQWRPIPRGDGQTLSLRVQTNGRLYQSYSMSFVEPWFGGKKPNSFSLSLMHTVQDYSKSKSYYYSSSDQKFTTIGGSVGLGRRLKWPDDYFSLYNDVSYQRYFLRNFGSSEFKFSNGVSHLLSTSITFSRNSQDQFIYPRRGSNFSIGLRVTPPYSFFKKDLFWEFSEQERIDYTNKMIADATASGDDTPTDNEIEYAIYEEEQSEKYKWIEFHKWTFKSAWYLNIVDNLVLATKADFGYLGYYNKDIGASPFEKFRIGGSGLIGYNLFGYDIIPLRGYDENQYVTPRKLENGREVDDGNLYVRYYAELRYPFSLNPSATIFGLTFVEGGNGWSSWNQFNPFEIKRSAGIGVRAFLPMFGLLGIDIGYGFDPIYNYAGNKIDGQQWKFHFTMGQQF